MDETVPTHPKPKTTADYKAEFTRLLAAMDRLNEQMDIDRADSERLKAETEIIKARTSEKLICLQEQVNSLSRTA